MCGIVGYLGKKEAQSILLDCLGRLEYRGYDSAGIATLSEGKLGLRHSVGKNSQLQSLLEQAPLPGQLGIAHTRWATHGKATDNNSHPHTDCSGSIAIVHNGIVENHFELREMLRAEGHVFDSQTDSEVIAHLIESNISEGLEKAVQKTLPLLHGSYAIAVISQQEPDKIIVARSGGPPLVIGHCDSGLLISSDISAILHYTRDIQILENDEIAVITHEGAKIILLSGQQVHRDITRFMWDQDAAEKGDFAHMMLKEIYEQPKAVINTIRGQNFLPEGQMFFPHAELSSDASFGKIDRITLLACGSSWHAALVGKYLIESISGTQVDVDISSEYRYRPHLDAPGNLVIGISQSGETADTLCALKEAKTRGSRILSICNVAGSSMSRESDGVIYTHAGPEIGVAATKTFSCQLTALTLFAVSLGLAKQKISATEAEEFMQSLLQLPQKIEKVLKQDHKLAILAKLLDNTTNALFLGRGILFPLAVEGALKLKEISYIHAEGYPAGELKHGPIALIDESMPVVVIATKGSLYEKVMTSIEEIKARGGSLIVIASEGDQRISKIVEHVFYVPDTEELLMPILMAVPLQLLAYHVAVQRGCDVDKPRNLAKSVTVE